MRSVSSVFSTLFLQLLAVRITLSCRARPLQGDSHHNTSHCTFHNTLFKELLGLLINYGAIIRQPRRRDVFKNQPRKWVTRRCEAACRPFTSFFLFFFKECTHARTLACTLRFKPSGGWLENTVRASCSRVGISFTVSVWKQTFGEDAGCRHLCAFNTVWPRVKHEMTHISSCFSEMF